MLLNQSHKITFRTPRFNHRRCLAVYGLFVRLSAKDRCWAFRNEKPEAVKVSVIIYTKPGCPYCAKAREHYTRHGISFEDRDAQENLEYRAEMLELTGGDPTVPVTVENGKLKEIGWEGRG